jgi:phosphatidylglycerophosphate synthase
LPDTTPSQAVVLFHRRRHGPLLNEVGDVISDLALYLPFALLPGVPLAALTAAIVMAALTEFACVAALLIQRLTAL